MIFDFMMMQGVLCLFLEHVGADAAQGALVIFGQLIAFVDIAANGANELFHWITSFPVSCSTGIFR